MLDQAKFCAVHNNTTEASYNPATVVPAAVASSGNPFSFFVNLSFFGWTRQPARS